MDFSGSSSLYDILEVAPDATPQEIRAAYLRAKNAYRADSAALYSLMSPDETQELLSRIEYAYQILSSPDRRRDYDRNFGRVDETSQVDRGAAVKSILASEKVVSIDRVPPMESNSSGLMMDELLVAPSTDFTAPQAHGNRGSAAVFGATEAPLPVFNQTPAPDRGWIEPNPFATAAPAPTPTPTPTAAAYRPPPTVVSSGADSFAPPVQSTRPTPAVHSLANSGRHPAPSSAAGADEIAVEIANETSWAGSFFRRVREARSVSIEELSEFTKISKTYLLAVEEDNFAKLPATVYLRGFITQYCKALKLPADKAVAAYLARFHQARPEKK